MRRSHIISFVSFVLLFAIIFSGCGTDTAEPKDKSNIEYTVVEDEDLPVELAKVIEKKKDKVLRLTYTTKDYTYIVVGYGKKDKTGYSIKVNGVYIGDGALYVDTNLIGPTENEQVNEVDTFPLIVIKVERREESVIFRM